jgi:hypothetical protein
MSMRYWGIGSYGDTPGPGSEGRSPLHPRYLEILGDREFRGTPPTPGRGAPLHPRCFAGPGRKVGSFAKA